MMFVFFLMCLMKNFTREPLFGSFVVIVIRRAVWGHSPFRVLFVLSFPLRLVCGLFSYEIFLQL